MSIECPTKESKMTDKEQVTNSKEQTNGSLKNQDKNFNENFTQEKEQIIIDGIQFNKFGDFYVDYDLNGKFQSISSSAKEYKILKSLIKQLARKTQECKQLKEDYAELEQECERLKSYGATLLADKNAMEIGRDDYMQRCKRLEQECEELKKENKKLLEKCLERKCKIIKLTDENATKEVIYKINGKSAKTVANKVNEIAAIVEGKDCKYNRYRKALEDIEEFIKNRKCKYCSTYKDAFCPEWYGEECDMKEILDIINKAKGSNNDR